RHPARHRRALRDPAPPADDRGRLARGGGPRLPGPDDVPLVPEPCRPRADRARPRSRDQPGRRRRRSHPDVPAREVATVIAPDLAQHFDGRRVLITGGLGFVGSTLAHELIEAGARVVLVDSLIPEYGGNLANIEDIRERVTVNISDVRDEHSFRYLIQGQDYLFNLAGQTSHLDSMRDPYADLEINCRSQLSI